MSRNIFLIGFLSALFCAATRGDEETKVGMMPVEPGILLRALPEKVDGWVLKRSKGWRGLGEWIETSVQRVFYQIVPEKGPAGEDAPGVVKISLKDTGKFDGGDLQLFADFKPYKNEEEGYEYLILNGHPAIVIRDKTGVEAQFLVSGRFVLTIYMENVPEKFLKNWYELVNINALRSIKDGPLVPLPEELTVIKINELDPDKSSRISASRAISDIPAEEVEDEAE